MRLGQLARKLALRPSEIVAYLAGKNIPIEEGSNIRLLDEHVVLVLLQFAPSRMEGVIGEPDENGETDPVDIHSAQPEIELTIQTGESPDFKTPDKVNEIREDKPEVIKAPKVELPGLKVLGKIEFPEPKKKEPPLIDPSLTIEGPTVREEPKKSPPEIKKGSPPKTERRDQRPKKNPIALQREREAMEAEKRRKAETERKKELRTRHYFKKVKPSAPTKALKLVKEPVEEIAKEQINPPKTVLGRFLKWLTT